ncbi:putative protease [Desulfohalotomaculum tongense]|uniref:DUF3656 domain-containing U32 family peptidase n=1 Tax=Desulforadius tongensis TaxID=1216062 RepID=UPI0019563940|nr:DUF3656 domain-containing protein [Desulforadius tongensis]MBM7854788.1 putative protease [Desulforadius tongensis]
MHKPELLAPAGSWEALVAAVQNGADAVYLGGQAFNARQSAANFDNEQLAQAVRYCHVRGVKVYVTVNIIIADEELTAALKFLQYLYNIGVDAVILQDLGLARLAKKMLPELPLHASTQMTVHNTPGVELLQQWGFKRVVLSREVSGQGISSIKKKTGADLEVFVHGALCVCYSGQCLMSSLIGGRSGNRGRCAQPCRLQYRLVDRRGRPLVDPAGAGEYLLSPRDLNLSEYIPQLIEAGVNSFKIEGRMKRPEYVATVTRVYRELIDQTLAEGRVNVTPRQARDLEQIFNRDFTTGYFLGSPGKELMSYKRPNNRGVLLGRVKGFKKGSDLVEISLQEPLQVGDGIEVWVTRGGRKGVEVSRIIHKNKQVKSAPAGSIVWIPIPGQVGPGDRIFKTHDAQLIQRAKISYTSSKEIRKIPLKFTVRVKVGQPLYMKAEDPQGIVVEARSPEVGQQAEKRPLTGEILKSQLDRLGNTPFALGELNCDITGEVMFPLRVINELRRRVVEKLEQKRSRVNDRPVLDDREFEKRLRKQLDTAARHPQCRGKTKLAVNVTELAALQAAVDAGADVVYFGGESYRSKKPVTLEDIKKAAGLCAGRGVEFILSTPRIMQDDELQRFSRFMEQALPYVQGVLVGNLGLLKNLSSRQYKGLVADFALNVYNKSSAARLAELGAARVTLSPELTMAQIKDFALRSPLPLETIVHGALPLMVTEYCALGSLMGGLTAENKCSGPCSKHTCGLKDRRGVIFPIEVDRFCHMHVFNSRELCLIEDVGPLAAAGISTLRVEAGIMEPGRVAAVVRAYRRVLGMYPLKEWKETAAAAKEELEQYSVGFTKGHYYRGVI